MNYMGIFLQTLPFNLFAILFTMNRWIIIMAMALAFQPLQGGSGRAENAGKRVATPDLSRDGWRQMPEALTQFDRDGLPLSRGAVLESALLGISAKTRSCSLNNCPWNYAMEIEVRPAAENFTGHPTHRSPELLRSSSECRETEYPSIIAAGLLHDRAYKWQARERIIVYKSSFDKNKLACIEPITFYSPWTGHGDDDSPSFYTPSLFTRTTREPVAVMKTEGSGSDGLANRLNMDDENYYRVWATTRAPYTTSWYALFRGVEEKARNLSITYKGYNSLPCNQGLDIWNWASGEWIELDFRETGEEEIVIGDLVPPGDMISYVGDNGRGEVMVRVRCSSNLLSFSSNGNTLKISYDQPIMIP